MKSELLSQENNFVTIKVTVDKDDFAAALKKTYREVAASVNIPGFRRGKAPKNIIDMRIGRENIKAKTLEDMMNDILDEICSEYELVPIASPEVDLDSIPDNEDIIFNVKYEVEPEVTLPELSEITADHPVFEVTDDMVENAFEAAKKESATYEPVARPAAKGDKVRAICCVKLVDENGEEKTVAPHMANTFEVDPMISGQAIFDALNGASEGDKREAKMPLPVTNENENKNTAAKTFVYDIDVLEVQERVDPEMNEEFFKKITPKEITSVDELKAEIRANIEARLKADARTALENDAISKIAAASQLIVPESMVKTQYEHLRSRYEDNIKKRSGMTIEEYYKDNDQDFKEFETKLMADCRRDVLNYLVVDACTKHFNITVSKDDLNDDIEEMAAKYGISADSVKEMLKSREEDFRNMIANARYRKTLDAVLGVVKINEVKQGVPAEEAAPAVEEAPAAEAAAAAEVPAAEE